MHKIFSVLIAIGLSLWISGGVLAGTIPEERKPVTIEADVITYEQEKETYTASGNVRISFLDLNLRADRVVLNMALNQATASGRVLLSSDLDTIEGEELAFDITRGTGVISQGKAFFAKNHLYIWGRKIEKTGERTYRGLDVMATTCKGEVPDWQLAGSVLEVKVDGYGTLKHGRLLVKGVPVFYVPYLIFPVKTTRQSGLLLPRISYSQKIHGVDIEQPYYQVIAENMDATLYLRYLEKSGLKKAVEFRYALSEGSQGTFYGDYLDDRRAVAETILGINRDWPEGKVRWSLYWQHETAFSPSSYLRVDLLRLSDIWYFRDFHGSNYYLDNYSPRGDDKFRRVSFEGKESLSKYDSTVRFVKKWDFYNLTGLFRHTEDLTRSVNDGTLQKYPEITLNQSTRKLLHSPVNYEFQSLYSYNYREIGQKGHLFDLKPIFSLPLAMGDYLQLNPSLTLRATLWSRDDQRAGGNGREGARYLYMAGLNLSTEVYRIFDVGSKGIEKVKHTIKPEVSYAYIPDVGQDDLPDYAVPVPPQNLITYGLTNVLMAKSRHPDGRISYREYLRLKLSQAYNFREADRSDGLPGQPWGNVFWEMDIHPSPYLIFSTRGNYDVHLAQIRRGNYDLNLTDRRGDSLKASYHYTKDTIEQLHISLKAVITKELDLNYLWKRDLLSARDVEQTLGLQYRRQCWVLDMSYTQKERDTRFMLNLALYGLGSIGN